MRMNLRSIWDIICAERKCVGVRVRVVGVEMELSCGRGSSGDV